MDVKTTPSFWTAYSPDTALRGRPPMMCGRVWTLPDGPTSVSNLATRPHRRSEDAVTFRHRRSSCWCKQFATDSNSARSANMRVKPSVSKPGGKYATPSDVAYSHRVLSHKWYNTSGTSFLRDGEVKLVCISRRVSPASRRASVSSSRKQRSGRNAGMHRGT